MTDRASLPDFELPATGNQRFQFSAFHGHPIDMYGRQARAHERSTFAVEAARLQRSNHVPNR